MDKQVFLDKVNEIFSENQFNYISADKALSDELISLKMFEQPIIGITNTNNDSFHKLKQENIIGKHFMLPKEWLCGAETVISLFFPFTEAIRKSNRQNMNYPSNSWMNGRIEGQYYINNFSTCLVKLLNDNGYEAVSPSLDKRFFMNTELKDNNKNPINKPYTSNWSERHVAYVCGVGTFSLSKGLITEKGIAGRLTSIITNLKLDADKKAFSRYDENCIMCGKCIKNCPVNAISFDHGKNNELCSEFLNSILIDHAPWYGCGKCQVSVPCEFENPNKMNLI
ncbi:4Fe-4S binding protein [Anaerosporobacter sp.]|uniref:4Fe-4S binding protein n=1 Tax=Anaerosporobacter sp. TaxID=1872529 RepID=UPI00286F24FB|nr:4Fe-4S binding protein [Anaerosporobacter sp.]